LGVILFCSFPRDPTNCFKGIISISSSVSDEFLGFSSPGGESIGRVVWTQENPESKSSSATLSCMNDSNEATTVLIPHRVERNAPQRTLHPSYNWVNSKVREFFSRYRSSYELRDFLSNTQIYSSSTDENIISFRRAENVDNVCHGREDDKSDFFYFYACFFSDLHIRFPLNDFLMGVLNFLNIAPTQLHPNGWASIQAFSFLCNLFSLSPSPKSFLYYYSSWPGKQPSWLSLISKPRIYFLKPFTSSYKDFKGGFFKVFIEEYGRKYFFNGDTPKFPFYWTNEPLKFNSWSYHSMDADDRRVIEVFGHFSYQIPTRALLRLYTSKIPRKDFISMYLFTFLLDSQRFLTLLNLLLIFIFNGGYQSESTNLLFETSE